MVTWGSAIRSRGRGACPLTPLNWNPHSLLQINPTPTPLPSTQLALVYSSYVYPPRSEERDSKMDGFKLDLFNKEAGINRVTGELLPPDWLGTKSCLYLIQRRILLCLAKAGCLEPYLIICHFFYTVKIFGE